MSGITHERYDEAANRERVAALAARGVDVWGPERVYIGADVALDNIEPGAVLRQATLRGARTYIGRGSCIGTSGHAEVIDCQIGRDVQLGAGIFQGATVLDEAEIRGFAELRPGTLLEEQTVIAHSVALKNTVLTATVVAGSLINFCDLFMSGGTSRRDHSEIGSGAIHFNFDPRGDKWSSLLGDVRGVLLRSAPVFVGGHCGLVGPIHIDFGAVVAAGSIVRHDVGPRRLHAETAHSTITTDFDRTIYLGLRRKLLATARLIGNLRALDAWYEEVRIPAAGTFHQHLYRGAQEQIRAHITERVKRVDAIIGKLNTSIEKTADHQNLRSCHDEHGRLIERRDKVLSLLRAADTMPVPPSSFLNSYQDLRGKRAAHLDAVRAVPEEAAGEAAEWLAAIANEPAWQLDTLLG